MKNQRISRRNFIGKVLGTITAMALGQTVLADNTTYVVRTGDTLYGIARRLKKENPERYGQITWEDIAEENNLKPPYIIKPGQRIRIPLREEEQLSQLESIIEIEGFTIENNRDTGLYVNGRRYNYKNRKARDLAKHIILEGLRLYHKYKDYPYVWGGDSFLPIEQQKKHPILRRYFTTYQAGSRLRGKLKTIPGVDCSGLINLIYDTCGINRLEDGRRTASIYKNSPHYTTVIKGKPSKAEVLEKAKPGDLLILANGRHVALYLGDGKILESSGYKKLERNEKTRRLLEEWRRFVRKAGANIPDDYRGGMQISDVNKYLGRGVYIRRHKSLQ